ncbi:hypothetical protein O5O45_21675 [Hahella aquimaris]|uniref:hypothetical protein n=1 Tax=Hahella sp. HNIBRBA332 TaxID=3015983 RepID=UPI00273C7698|nr:hypothetical protein [Hahella sp. HNIBRBA332]WLQ12340.1 hypothetical protein O5O45_21675 [Hahella sp. HNIBRBA332]
MSTTFNKIHRLKRLWTWEAFVAQYEAGPDIKTLKANYLHPHHKPNKNTVDIINALHEREFPNPFPAALEGMFDLYEDLYRRNGDLSQEENIGRLEHFLRHELSIAGREPVGRARLLWLLGDMLFDRCLGARKRNQEQRMLAYRREAIQAYQSALDILEQTQLANLVIRYKLRQNILACYLNASKRQGVWTKDPETLSYFHESSFLARTKELLAEEPFQWSIARNGLRFASLLENADEVIYFFACLLKVSARFADFDYQPYQAPAIGRSKDFVWARENVLTDERVRSLIDECKLKGKTK